MAVVITRRYSKLIFERTTMSHIIRAMQPGGRMRRAGCRREAVRGAPNFCVIFYIIRSRRKSLFALCCDVRDFMPSRFLLSVYLHFIHANVRVKFTHCTCASCIILSEMLPCGTKSV